jgi:SAM-dependent methyltransferase
MNRIDLIRQEEKIYHDHFYQNNRLFEKGSWLYKPVETVMEQLSLLMQNDHLSVLDLGSGVGRNSIPIAEKIKTKKGKVICVDLLDSAIEKLNQYSYEYGVEQVIQTVKADIGDYPIKEGEFDLIVAVSSLEHLASEKLFEKVVQRMVGGTKSNGINCLIVNSQVEEVLIDTNENLDALIEINLKTEDMLKKLSELYGDGWEVLCQLVKPLEYAIYRNEKPVRLKTNAITYVIRKK